MRGDLPCFINGGQVLGGFLDEWDKDQACFVSILLKLRGVLTHKVVRDAALDDVLDLLDQEDGRHGDSGERNGNGNATLDEGQLVPFGVVVPVLVDFLITAEDLVEDGAMALEVVPEEPVILASSIPGTKDTNMQKAARRITAVARLMVKVELASS